jgi:dTDP-4-dehydrorhamnose reductase
MRILITGANGQLGRALVAALASHELTPLTHADLDIADRDAVRTSMTNVRPEVVLNPAAWTDTAGCERDPARARVVNGEAPGFIAEACLEIGAALVHISSNEVFDGEKGVPYYEDDAPNAVNEYGRSKLVGEQTVTAALPEHYIVRTSWLYGPGRVSFPEKVLDRARADGKLRGVTDETASPTWTVDLAAAIAQLIETRAYGVYHLVNEGGCSRKEWAEEIVRLAGLVVPVEAATQAEFGLPFRKPVLSTLANNRAAALGIRLRPWREALAQHMAAVNAGSTA